LFLLCHFLIGQMLTMPVFSKTSYSCLSNAYENSSFNFCVCLHRGIFVVVSITWNLIFVLFLSSAVTGFYITQIFHFCRVIKIFFINFKSGEKVLMIPLELHFCSNRHILKVNLVNLNHCCMSHSYSELSSCALKCRQQPTKCKI